MRESCDQLKAEYDIDASYLRLKAYPFTEELKDFIRRHERVYVVDQNRDAQLLGLMRLEFDVELLAKLRSVRYYGGLAAGRPHGHRRNRPTGGKMSTAPSLLRPKRSTASGWRS